MKDYKKILEDVVNIINTTEKSDIGFTNICTYIGENCPELAESEDERIRKRIYNYINVTLDDNESAEKDNWLAWLEKQSEKFQYWKPSEEQLEALDYAYNSCPDTERGNYYEGVLETIIDDLHKLSDKQGERKKPVFEMKTPEESLCIDSDTYHKIVDECIFGEQKPDYCHHKVDLSNCSEEYRKAYYDGWNNCNMQHSQCKSESNDVVKCLINGMKFYYEDNDEWGTDKFSMKVKDILSWLEKQREQKPVISDDALREGIAHFGITQHQIDNWLKKYVDVEKQCEQKANDKVEPKFHEGDWVVQENIGVYKVIEICESWYEVIDAEDNHYSISFDKEYMCHPWDISDAKDGDVLVTVDDNLPFIYKGCLDPNHPNSPFAYCGIYAEGNFSSNWNEVNRRWTDVKVQPATKEQHNLLTSKMREAGWEFDFDKKELKKIEHKHFCELDNSYTCVKFPFKAKVKSSDTIVTIHGGQLSLDGKEWIKYQSDAEDGYEVYEPNNLELVCEIEQEPTWSEEDEKRAERLHGWLDTLVNYIHQDVTVSLDIRRERMQQVKQLKTWLKSLKERI